MRVVCENCGATYKIPESKLVKEVNKATCRKCGFRMMIRRPAAAVAATTTEPEPDDAATQVTANPLQAQSGEQDIHEAHTRIEKAKPLELPPENEWSDEGPTQVRADPLAGAGSKPPRKPTPKRSEGKAPADMILALCATFAAAAGPMLLATNAAGGDMQRMAGLFLGLFGSLTCLFLLVTGNLWRQKGNVPISIALAMVLSMGGTAFVEVAVHDDGSAPAVAQDKNATADAAPKAAVEAADGEDEANADALADGPTGDDAETKDAVADAAPATKTEAASTAPEIGNPNPLPPEPVEDEEALDEPDFDDIPPAATRSDAEERRRREMEEAAARAKAEREARDAERRRARETKRERRSRAAAAPEPAPTPAGPPKMKSLPLTVVDTMIKTNMTVKRCFFAEQKASGSLPSRVNVYFTVMPNGKVASARVTTAEYKGTTLDSCLGRAFKGINFPAFEGDPLSMTYPFIL